MKRLAPLIALLLCCYGGYTLITTRPTPPAPKPSPTASRAPYLHPLPIPPEQGPATSAQAQTPSAPDSDVPAAAPRGYPSEAAPDGADIDDVAVWFAKVYFTVDTRSDSRPSMGAERAAQWATPQFAKTLRTPPPQPARAQTQWATMVAGNRWTTVKASLTNLATAEDSPRMALRAVRAVVDTRGKDSFSSSTYVVALRLVQGTNGWRVDGVQLMSQ